MATHSSVLEWKIPWAEEPGGLQSMGLQRVPTQLSMHTYSTMGGRELYLGWQGCSRSYL